jgi:hypothetical protein
MASLKIWGLASDKIEKRKIFFVCVDNRNTPAVTGMRAKPYLITPFWSPI